MNKEEVLEALKYLNNEDRLDVIETATRLIREEIDGSTEPDFGLKEHLTAEEQAVNFNPEAAIYDVFSPESHDY